MYIYTNLLILQILFVTGICYLIYVGYVNMIRFLAPYGGVHYHLQKFDSISLPQNPKKLFIHCHSSLQTTIKRTFGIFELK